MTAVGFKSQPGDANKCHKLIVLLKKVQCKRIFNLLFLVSVCKKTLAGIYMQHIVTTYSIVLHVIITPARLSGVKSMARIAR